MLNLSMQKPYLHIPVPIDDEFSAITIWGDGVYLRTVRSYRLHPWLDMFSSFIPRKSPGLENYSLLSVYGTVLRSLCVLAWAGCTRLCILTRTEIFMCCFGLRSNFSFSKASTTDERIRGKEDWFRQKRGSSWNWDFSENHAPFSSADVIWILDYDV